MKKKQEGTFSLTGSRQIDSVSKKRGKLKLYYLIKTFKSETHELGTMLHKGGGESEPLANSATKKCGEKRKKESIDQHKLHQMRWNTLSDIKVKINMLKCSIFLENRRCYEANIDE